MAISLPAVFIFNKYRFLGKRFLESIFIIPFVLPGVIVSLGFILLFGNNGYLNNFLRVFNLNFSVLYSLRAIILAHSFFNFPIVLKIVGQSLEKINTALYSAAQTLGAGKITVFFKVTLPVIFPSIINASSIVFIYCFMSFAVILILGSVRYTTIEVNIFILVNNLFNLRLGMALGVIQIVVTFILINLNSIFYKINQQYLLFVENKELNIFRKYDKFSLNMVLKKISCYVYIFFLVILLVGPLVSIFYYAMVNEISLGYNTLSAFVENDYSPYIGTRMLKPFFNSLYVAFLTIVITLKVCVFFSLFLKNKKIRKIIEIFTFLPIGVSAVTFSLGYLKIINLDYVNIHPYILLALAHSAISLPFVSRIFFQNIDRIDKRYYYVAESLGSSQLRVLREILFPLIKKTLLIGCIFTFAISFGEFGASMMLRQRIITIPVAIYRFMASYRFNEATFFASILILICIIIFYFSENLKSLY